MVKQKNRFFWWLRLLIIAAVIANIGGFIWHGTASAAGWYNAGWLYRKKITLNAAGGGANLTNFPVLVQITSDTNLGPHALTNGNDILFTSADGTTKLDHEIEKYTSNGVTASLTAWVRIPTLSYSGTTDIYMYYGNAASGAQQNAAGVWDSNYKLVMHLNQASGGAGAIIDSTSNHNNGTDYNSPTFGVTGVIDGSMGFNGTNQYIDCTNLTAIDSASAVTYEVWAKPAAGVSGGLISKFTSLSQRTHIYMVGTTCYWNVSNGTNTYGICTVSTGVWHHFVMVYDGTQTGNTNRLKAYVDGVQQTLTFTGTIPATTAAATGDLMLGRQDTNYFKDTIDEARVSTTPRSAGWAATSYANENNPAGFISVGAEETAPSPPTVTTSAATSVAETNATLNGNITATGGDNPAVRGFQWSTSPSFTTSSNWTESGSFGTGTFSYALPASTLTQGQLYYYRAVAQNAAGWTFASSQSFLTKPEAPTAFTAAPGTTGEINLSWTKGTGANRTMVRMSSSGYPATTGDGTLVYFDTGTSTIAGSLTPGATYYFSAWSEITNGTQQFSTLYATATANAGTTGPTVGTTGFYNLTDTTANITGTLTYDGGEACQYAFEWGTATGVYTANTSWTGSLTTGQNFSALITGLLPGTRYYYRAKALNSSGVSNGTEVNFLTKPSTPTLFSATAAGISQINLAWTPGAGSTSTIIVMKTGGYPSNTGDGSTVYNSSGSSTSVTLLSAGTTYYFSAWAVTTDGYSSQISDLYATASAATATAASPSVTTNAAAGVDETVATISGTLTDNGGEDCQWTLDWGTTSGVYPNSTGWSVGTITTGATFSQSLSGLSRGTKYYFRAGVRNSTGPVYGLEQEFLTKPAEPAYFNATVISDTQIDVVWTPGDGAGRTMVRYRTDTYPTDYNDGTEAYFGSATSVSVTGLTPGTVYYFRAWSEKTGSQQWSNNFVQLSITTSGSAPSPPSVGGTVMSVNKALILAPWLAIAVGILLVAVLLFRHVRKRYYVKPAAGLVKKHFRFIKGDHKAFKD